MKKLNHVIVAAMAVLLLTVSYNTVRAGETEKYGQSEDRKIRVSHYSEINVSSGIDVVLTDGEKGLVRVECDPSLYSVLNIHVKGETLMIYVKSSMYRSNHNSSIKVYVPASGVTKLSASGASDIVSEVLLAVPELRIGLSGSSDMSANVECGRVVADMSGSSDLKLTGNTDVFKLSASGSSDVDCKGLIANRVFFTVSGSSDASVYANEEIKGSASGASSVYYRGDAKIEEVRVSGAADVSRKK